MKITILHNAVISTDPSDKDTENSAKLVAKTLKENDYEVELMEIKTDRIKNIKSDFVFNLVEWGGKNFQMGVNVIKKLDELGIPYSGSHAWGYELSSDKVLMKQKMTEFKIPTPKYTIIFNFQFSIFNQFLKFPIILKPVYEHCAIGVSQKSVVTNDEEFKTRILEMLDKFKQPILAEEFIDGLEAHVTVIEKQKKPYVLPPAIFKYDEKDGYWGIMSYDAKWNENSWENKMSHWFDGPLPVSLNTKIENVAKLCYEKLGGRSYSRIDMRIKNNKVFVLEINNNPGISWDDDSGITYSAKAAGLDFADLLKNIVDNALIT